MKTLKNSETEIQLVKGDPLLDYRALIRSCLDNQPRGGFTRQNLRERGRIERALEGTGDCIELEDADAENLKQIVGQMRWAMRHADLLAFHDAVESL